MTTKMSSPHRRPIRVFNTESDTVPPFGVAVKTGDMSDDMSDVKKVDKSGRTDVLFNGPTPIPPQSEGQMYRGFPAQVLCASAPNQGAVGEVWGTRDGSYSLHSTSVGFKLTSDVDQYGIASVELMDNSFAGFVRVTTPGADGTEFSDGIELDTDSGTDIPLDGAEVKIRDPNGGLLVDGRIYHAQLIGLRNRVRTFYTVSGAGSSSSSSSPLGTPCLVVDAYGNAVGIAQRWVKRDGTVRCEVSGICEGDDCGPGSVPPPPPPPVPVFNVVRVSLLVAGGGENSRPVTVNGVTQYTDGSGHTTFFVEDGTYTAILDEVIVGETVGWELTGADGGPDMGSGATTNSFTITSGGFVDVGFTVTSPP